RYHAPQNSDTTPATAKTADMTVKTRPRRTKRSLDRPGESVTVPLAAGPRTAFSQPTSVAQPARASLRFSNRKTQPLWQFVCDYGFVSAVAINLVANSSLGLIFNACA